MRKFYRIIVIVLIFSMINNLGCINKKNENNEELSILIENPKISDNDFINIMLDEYKKENKNISLKVDNSKNIEETKVMINKNRFDLIFCARNSMIELSRKGLLRDIRDIYEANNVNSRFYNIVCNYGRYDNTYYGIGLMPYSLNLIINKNIIKEFSNNDEFLNIDNIINIASKYNKGIPVILLDDMNLNLAIQSFIANNLILDNTLEENYSDDKSKYMKTNQIQDSFKTMNSIVKKLNDNGIYFTKANEKIIEEIKDNKFPLILTTTLSLKNINQNLNMKSVSNILNNAYKISPVVIIDHNLCAFQYGKNEKHINKFFDFICKDDIYIKLAKEGYISANVKGATYIEGLQREFMWTISLANENNIPFYFNLPNKMEQYILEEVNKVMDGKYDNQEWNRIIDKSF